MNVVRGRRSVKLREKLRSVKIQSTANLFQGVVPANITLKAVPVGFTAKSYKWTLNESSTIIGTNQSFIIANNQVEIVNNYKVVVTATDDSTYEESISIAKVRDGSAIVALKRYLDEINVQYSQLTASYNSLFDNPKIGKYKSVLRAIYNIYKTSYTELVDFINAIITQNSFSPTEENSLNALVADYKLNIIDLVEALETALKLTTDYLDDTITRINEVTSFLDTTINGNVIGTGVLMVGSGSQSNAFISGLTDKGNESIRFAAGKSYQEKEKSPFQVLDNGLVRFCNPENGKVVFELGAKMGKVMFDIYNEQGLKTATIGPQGIVFTGYTPENYDKQRFRRLTYQSDNETELINEVLNYSKILYNQYDGTFKHMLNNAETYAYQYSAGYNFESANNAQYEGKYFQDENKLGAFMQDGWYATYYENIITQSINVNIYCQIILINSGRIIKQYIVSETKPWNWFYIF